MLLYFVMFPSNCVLLFLIIFYRTFDRALAWVMGVVVGLSLVRDSIARESTTIANDLRDKNHDALFFYHGAEDCLGLPCGHWT